MTQEQVAALRKRAERGQDTAVLALLDDNARLREVMLNIANALPWVGNTKPIIEVARAALGLRA